MSDLYLELFGEGGDVLRLWTAPSWCRDWGGSAEF